METSTIISVVGWCAVLNIALLGFSSLMIISLKEKIIPIHQKMFSSISKEKIEELYFDYLAKYKIMVIVFNIVPYIALKIVF